MRAFAPGRVNLIGEHTDYTGGLVLPMALTDGITITGEANDSGRVVMTSDQQSDRVEFAVPFSDDPAAVDPAWGRFLAGAARAVGMTTGFTGSITSTLPSGGTGLSTSSALTCAALLAFGGVGDRAELAQLAQQVEAEASGVMSGIMDQLTSMSGQAGHSLLIDCNTLDVTPIAMPDDLEVLVFHSGQPRLLADSEYNLRRQTCEAIEAKIGPLRLATLADVESLADPIQVKRGRHVVTENQRVLAMVEALTSGRLDLAGDILAEGHRSLSEDYEVSTPIVDAQQAKVAAMPGVYGARLTGGGFGGSLVALVEPGTDLAIDEWWHRASAGPGASAS